MNLRHEAAPLNPANAPAMSGTSAAREPAARSAAARDWRAALVAIGLAAVVFGIVFRAEIAAAVRVWIESTAYNHCFLIIPLTGFLLWERRSTIRAVAPAPKLWPVAIMPLISVVWLVAAVLDIYEVREIAVMAMFEVVLLAALGTRVFRLLLAPLLFLFFLVPMGAFLVPTLQKITADITVAGLQVLHIPVFSDGNMIEIPEGTFEIAEACAGLRFLVASSVFGCFFAILMYRSRLRRMLFIVLSVAVPIGANGLRALGIIWLAHLEGSAAAVEADHVLYGWLFFSVVILILIAIGTAFSEKSGRRPEPPLPAAPERSTPRRFATAISAAVLLAMIGPAYAARLDSAAPPGLLHAAAGPEVGKPWQPLSNLPAVWRPKISGADRQFLDSFKEPGSGVVVRYLALYRLRAVGNRLTNSENRIADDRAWQLARQSTSDVSLDGRRVKVTQAEIVHQPYRRLVWSFYVVGGEIAAGPLKAKLLQARAVLLGRARVGAFVAVSANMDDSGHDAAEQLTAFLAANQPLTQYLDRVQ
ncbi:MAG TPA: exosortase A [Stellaceae bacterium]|nr:exosortase A [Stellaceae bacterium]